MPTTVRFRPDLDALSGSPAVDVEVTERRSAKDLVESLGVPHTEIGLLLLDGVSVDLAHHIEAGSASTVTVAPPDPAPPPADRFAADVHLGRLAELLRLLGFDTTYDNDADDRDLAHDAARAGRVVLSRDRGLLKRAVVEHGYLVRSTDPETQAVEVLRRYALAPRAAPFTRCLRCNGELEEVAKDDVVDDLQPGTRRDHHRFVRCRACGQVFWAGSHHERLVATVERLLPTGGHDGP